MSLSIYYTPDLDHQIINVMTARGNVAAQEISSAYRNADTKVLVLSQQFLEKNGLSSLHDVTGVYVVLNQETDIRRFKIRPDVMIEASVGEINPIKLQSLIRSAELRYQMETLRRERDAHLRRLKELNHIGIALSTERDPVRLLNMILQKSREITRSDAGSLYLVEGDEEAGKQLRFKISQNDSIPINYQEFVIPISRGSIAGYVATTGESISIEDVYKLESDQEFHFNRQFDESTGYHTMSLLTVPMRNHLGEIIGIIQLINRKQDAAAKLTAENYRDLVQPFDENDEDLVSSLASQAAVALENSGLIKDIQRLFEGFVTASVTAIESRDPTTSGHSFRVANLTVGLAVLVDKDSSLRFRGLNFTSDEIKEMRYAALLHDFGKVGVRENVLVKAKKLYPMQMDLIKQRFALMRKSWEAEFYKSKVNLLLSQGKEDYYNDMSQLEVLFQKRLQSLDDYLNFIVQSNEPTVSPEGNFEKILQIASEKDLIPPETEGPLLAPDEVHLLSIRKGNLNDRERTEMESHVTHTFLFLSKIPWTSELKHVPRIAYGHHEKLNGRGYPNRLKADEIPIQTRIMTISDIYDALTASDRPYKRAVPPEKALDIIADEVKEQQLDGDLFDLFVNGKVYQLATGKS